MIRRLIPSDIPVAAQLWLQTSLKAHSFIDSAYWQDNLEQVKEMLTDGTETYVFINRHKICGFISLLPDNFIGALFVSEAYQGNKIGTKLLNYALRRRSAANLHVYADNRRAINFYHRHGFKIIREQKDEATGMPELMMAWAKGCKNGLIRRHGES